MFEGELKMQKVGVEATRVLDFLLSSLCLHLLPVKVGVFVYSYMVLSL